jgi:hypothetical protein
VLDRLKIGFGIEETEWGHDNLPVEYKQFYDDLADMLPQIKARELTPRKTATRSNTTLPSSSVPPSSSPLSVRNTKRSALVSTRSTPSKTPFPAGTLRSPGKYQQSSTLSPSLPARLATPMKVNQVTTLHLTTGDLLLAKQIRHSKLLRPIIRHLKVRDQLVTVLRSQLKFYRTSRGTAFRKSQSGILFADLLRVSVLTTSCE